MKILVTGHEGQLARALTEEAACVGLAISYAARPHADVTDLDSLRAIIARERPDIVVNAAAHTQVDQAENDAALAYAVNDEGAGHVARASAEAGLPIIHVSTDYVFDGTKGSAYTEHDAVSPLGVYGASKRAGEVRVAQENPNHLILRTSWVFSPWGKNFCLTMLRLAETREVIGVVDDQSGCPTYAPHLAAAIVALARRVAERQNETSSRGARRDEALASSGVRLEGGSQAHLALQPSLETQFRQRMSVAAIAPRDEADGDASKGHAFWGTYHLAGRGETSWCGFAREIMAQARAAGLPAARIEAIATKDFPTLARRPPHSGLDCTTIREACGIDMPPWQSGVAACVARIKGSGGNPQQRE